MSKHATLLLIAILAFQSIPQGHANPTWSIRTVDENGELGGPPSIALDSNGNPHMAYGAYENGYYRNPLYVMYASWNGSEWIIENVTQGGITDLALDSNNNPHIVFKDVGRLMYANLNSKVWNIQTIVYYDDSLATPTHVVLASESEIVNDGSENITIPNNPST